MIIKVFRQGQKKADFIVKYLLSEDRHNGFKPEVVEGNAELTKNIVNNLTNKKHKYITGVISFREGETLTKKQQYELIESFQSTFCPFDDPARVNFLWVMHYDKGRLELHWLSPRVDLKTGKAFNLHPPGKANKLFFETFTRLENDKYGFDQVDWKKKGRRLGTNNKKFYISIIADLYGKRKEYIVNNYSGLKTIKRKGSSYGRNKINYGFAGKNTHFRNISNVCKLKIEGIGKKQRINGKASNGSNGDCRKNDAVNSRLEKINSGSENFVQHSFSSQQVSDRIAQLRKSLGAIAAPMSVEDEIRALALQLNECSFSEAPSIQARLNFLHGMKSRQEGAAPRPKFK